MAGYRLNPKQDYTAYFPALLLLVSILIMTFALTNFNMNILLIQNPTDLSGILIGFGSGYVHCLIDMELCKVVQNRGYIKRCHAGNSKDNLTRL